MYEIKCECGECYFGQTGRTVQCRVKEQMRALNYSYFRKSIFAEQSIENKHKIVYEEI